MRQSDSERLKNEHSPRVVQAKLIRRERDLLMRSNGLGILLAAPVLYASLCPPSSPSTESSRYKSEPRRALLTSTEGGRERRPCGYAAGAIPC